MTHVDSSNARAKLEREQERRDRNSDMATCSLCKAILRRDMDGIWVGKCECDENSGAEMIGVPCESIRKTPGR